MLPSLGERVGKVEQIAPCRLGKRTAAGDERFDSVVSLSKKRRNARINHVVGQVRESEVSAFLLGYMQSKRVLRWAHFCYNRRRTCVRQVVVSRVPIERSRIRRVLRRSESFVTTRPASPVRCFDAAIQRER